MPSPVPIVVQLPLSVTLNAVRVPMESPTKIISIKGSLQALVAGSFQVDVTDDLGNAIGSLLWDAPGLKDAGVEPFVLEILAGGYLSFSVASIGVGALGCYITVWAVPG